MMKPKILILIGLVLVTVLTTTAYADGGLCNPDRFSDLEKRVAELEAIVRAAPVPPVEIKACNDPTTDLQAVAAGFKCRTSKGAIYERVTRNHFGEPWKGPDGLIWSDHVGYRSQQNAVDLCKILGGTLPTRADFERGEANGFREVVPNMKDRWFWSSSVYPNISYSTYVFYSNHGDIGYDFRNFTGSVRCVAR